MQNIQMVDLQGQYRNVKTEIDAAIQNVIDRAAFINGEEVGLFARELEQYLGIKHVIPCANGTDALQLAIMALDLPPGSEIIVPAFNYVATAEVIALLGMVPRFVDVHPAYFTIQPERIEEAINDRTKAIMPVHLFGQCADMEPILQMANKHNLYVIEDAAQAIGAQYTFVNGSKAPAGGMGIIGTTSFFPSKNLGCYGDGGAVFTNDDELAARIKAIANHGQRKKYVYQYIGINSRLDTIQAALLRVKLQYLNKYTAARQKAAAYYNEHLCKIDNLKVPAQMKASTHVYHQYCILLPEHIDRDTLKQHLQSVGIPTMVYYPGPLHLQEAYLIYGYKPGEIKVSEALCKHILALPMHTELTTEQQNYIIEHINDYIQKASAKVEIG
jgi:dTDP-4-amino-4,6-dideoxygalactose transaminase